MRSLDLLRRRVFATRRIAGHCRQPRSCSSLGSMAGSIVWTLGHQETLAALGGWLSAQAGQAAWLGVRGLASNFIEQPWFARAQGAGGQPGPPRARLRARARSPTWAGCSRFAASWLCRPSRWPMPASSAARSRSLALRRRCRPEHRLRRHPARSDRLPRGRAGPRLLDARLRRRGARPTRRPRRPVPRRRRSHRLRARRAAGLASTT